MEGLKPKKKTSAYLYFCRDAREASRSIKVEELADLWNDLKSNPAKKKEYDYYLGLAKKDSDRFDREYAVYKGKLREESKVERELERLKIEEQKIREKIQKIEETIMRKESEERDRKKEIDMKVILQKIQNSQERSRPPSSRDDRPTRPSPQTEREERPTKPSSQSRDDRPSRPPPSREERPSRPMSQSRNPPPPQREEKPKFDESSSSEYNSDDDL